ncbi:MAG: hypothetical protein V4489_05765 [Chlamydiota bacterium]
MFRQKKIFFILSILTIFSQEIHSGTISDNQTDALSPIYPPDSLPFTIDIELSSISLPGGVQSGALAIHNGKALYISGRTNGMHGFNADNDNFPPLLQNTNVYVVDLETKKVYVKSLNDKSSGLTQMEVDSLSTTAPQYQQTGETLYVVGGYGVDTATGEFSTKPILSAINVPGLMKWAQQSNNKRSAKQYIRQISNPIFQVTGGALYRESPHDPFLLIFGQDFEGFYTDGSSGAYTEQVRTFNLIDDGVNLTVFSENYKHQNPNYRRRDLNIVPIVRIQGKSYIQSYVALSGVFTLQTGIWTVPVFIDSSGNTFMPNPSKDSTFKQAMNNYNSAHVGLFSKKANQMHTVILGGISYVTYADGVFSADSEIPFTNNITDIVIDKHGNIKQYLLDVEYPFIPAGPPNTGNTLLFGAGARFAPVEKLPLFSNAVFSLDSLKKKTLLGYVVGGIMSALPNTNTQADSAASPYVFKVFATPH